MSRVGYAAAGPGPARAVIHGARYRAELDRRLLGAYAWALKYARGRVLELDMECETYPIKSEGLRPDFGRNDVVPFLDVVATLDPQNGQVCLPMLNRDLSSERELRVDWRDLAPSRVLACETLTGSDLKAANTFEQPKLVAPRPLEPPRPGPTMTFKLPRASYSVAHLATS